MQTLATGLAADATSDSFQTKRHGDVYIEFTGTFDASPPDVTMQVSDTKDGSYITFTADGVNQVFTEVSTHRLSLPGGKWFRFDVENTGTNSINIKLAGDFIDLPDA